MTRKERRIDEAIKNLRDEVKRCRPFAKKYAKDEEYYKALESRMYCNHIEFVLDQIEYYLEEGRMP